MTHFMSLSPSTDHVGLRLGSCHDDNEEGSGENWDAIAIMSMLIMFMVIMFPPKA